MTIDELADKFADYSPTYTDQQTISRIVKKAKPYIKKIIHRLDIPNGIEYSQQDLEQEAAFLVVKALQNHDSSLDTKFSTYMYLRVRGGLIQYLRKHDTLTRTQRNQAGEVSKAVHDLSQELGRRPSHKEIAHYLDKTPKEVSNYIRRLNSRNSQNYEDVTLDGGQQVDQEMIDSEDRIKSKLKELSVRDRIILILSYFHDLSNKQMSKVVDLHFRYISTLKSQAIRELKE